MDVLINVTFIEVTMRHTSAHIKTSYIVFFAQKMQGEIEVYECMQVMSRQTVKQLASGNRSEGRAGD